MEFLKYFKDGSTFKKTDLGLTNSNYVVDEFGVKYMVKHYSNHVTNNEFLNTSLVSNFDVMSKYYGEDYKITLKLDAKTFEQVKYSQENLIRIASTVKRFHNSGIVSKNIFNPFEELEKYKKETQNQQFELEAYNDVIKAAKTLWNASNKVFCHNDLVPGNILFGNKLYLIDWEYSGMNDPLFDVASFINENNLAGTSAENVFLTWYFDKVDSAIIENVEIYNKFQCVLWGQWANMMFDKTGNNKYNKILNDKLGRLK